MKKIILTVLLVSVFVSCKKELPSNIKSAVNSCESMYDAHRKRDSIILSLTTQEIDKLPLDTITKMIGDLNFHRKWEESSEKELEQILIANPEYSDYEEVKNMKKSYYDDTFRKSAKIEMYLNDKQMELMSKEYLKY